MKKEEINEIKINAHHPRGATFVLKNTMQTRVGAGPVSAQNKNLLQTKCVKQLQNNVGACIARSHNTGMLHIDNQNAITIISLVITIIILLILAGVTINLTLGENGIFKLAENAKEKYENVTLQEYNEIAKVGNYIGNSRNNMTQGGGAINVSNEIAVIANDTDWVKNSYEYTATQDCYILGWIGSNGGVINIYINNVQVGKHWTYLAGSLDYDSINYYIKKGDKISFVNSDGLTLVNVRAYGIK